MMAKPPSRNGVRVTEPTAASGREREAEEGKVTSGQEGLQPVAVRDDNFSGQNPRIKIAETAESKNISRVTELTAASGR